MDSVREFLDSKQGKYAAGGFVAIAVLIALLAAKRMFGSSSAVASSRERTFMCAETGKSFHYTVRAGTPVPVPSPYSGKDTGYPAELCYWTADGGTKDEPTLVLLNVYKHVAGPTFCPDCGRLVVGHNPAPGPGVTPPPTESEYRQRKAERRAPKELNRDDRNTDE